MDQLGLTLAILSALCLGSNKLAIRKTLFNMDESFAALIAILFALPTFGLPLLIYGWGKTPLSWEVIGVFALAGILNFAVGRYFIWKSIATIGANRGNIIASSQVLYAVAIAIIFLGQSVDLYSGVGILLVLVGILLVSYRGLKGTPFTQKQLKSGIVYGALGGFLWGISQVLMQIGIAQYKNATAATFITFTASIVGVVPILFFVQKYSEVGNPFRIDKKSFLFITIAGLLSNFGLYFRFASLQTVPLTIVATVNGTNPMITLILSYFLIRNVEFIDRKTVFGILSSVLGVALMSF